MLMICRQVSIAHRHLKRPMAEEFTNCAEIDAVHDQSTGKSVPVAMPGIIRKLCCFENTIEPISLASQLPSGGVEEDPRQLGPLLIRVRLLRRKQSH